MSFKLKYVAASCLLLSSTLAFAGNYKAEADYKGESGMPCPTIPALMDGLYLGGQLGYDTYNVKENISLVSGAVAADPNINANGFVGGLFLGYGKYFREWYYLGGEIIGNVSNASASWTGSLTTVTSYYSKVTVNSTYGLALIPGIKLSQSTLTYLKFGYNRANIKYQESISAPDTSNSTTGTVGGYSYGLGMETLITGNWSLRGEYTYTNYGSFNSTLSSTATTGVNPSDNQLMVGLLYHV